LNRIITADSQILIPKAFASLLFMHLLYNSKRAHAKGAFYAFFAPLSAIFASLKLVDLQSSAKNAESSAKNAKGFPVISALNLIVGYFYITRNDPANAHFLVIFLCVPFVVPPLRALWFFLPQRTQRFAQRKQSLWVI